MARRYERGTFYQPVGTDDGKARTSAMLSDALSGFTRQAANIGAAINAQKGAEAGALSTGKPTLKSKFTAYGQAFNDAATRNYLIEQFTDMETQLGRLELEAGDDPEAFAAAADGVRKGALQDALPEARAQLGELYARRIAEGTQKLTKAQIAGQKELTRVRLNEGLQTLQDSIGRKMTSGDPELMAQAEEEEVQLKLMIDGAVNSRDLTEAEAIVLRGDAVKTITRQVITGEFERQIQSGNAVDFLQRVMATPVEDLPDADKQQLIGELFGRLNRWQSLQTEAAQTSESAKKGVYERTERLLTRLWMNGELTTDVLNRVNDSGIASAETVQQFYTRIRENEGQGTDDRTKALFQLNILDDSITEDVIMERSDLSWADKRLLIEEKRKKLADFADTEVSQEARRRISAAFGGSDGFSIAFLEPDKAKQRGDALTLWWNWMQGLPPEKRDQNAMKLARDAIKQVNERSGVTVDETAVELAVQDGVPDDKAREALKRLRGGQ